MTATKVQVNSSGKIYVTSGNKVLLGSGGGSTPVISTLNVTPTTSVQQIIAPDNIDGYSPINVSAVTSSIDSNITAANIKKDVQILGVTGTYEGGSSGGGEYQLRRIKDDSNNEIGTAFMLFTDGNGNKYDVVCLDAAYRLASGQWCSNTGTVTNMPLYGNQKLWEAAETATQNTQLILDYCTANSYTSTACTHCRSLSFTIDGVTYYGQFPNIIELINIFMKRTAINTADITASSYSSLVIPNNTSTWSSSQFDGANGWFIINYASVELYTKTNTYFVIPVLEIPNTL